MGTDKTPIDSAPTEGPDTSKVRHVKSLFLVNTGDGKGKSSAAFGVMLRSIARGWNVAVIQYLKSGGWNTGEEKIGRQLGVDWWVIGEGFTWDSSDLNRDRAVAQEAWKHAKLVITTGAHHLVILDEITYPMNWGWISSEDVIHTIGNRPEHVSVVATGRDAPAELIDIADTVSEVRNVKHAFASGIAAKKGIDF
ncbi:MAG: cob(I)yrinic acid a,c-diamide adenosyltransferase [Ilumatobacteraceae bacterium]